MIIANILNTLIGLALVYVAILDIQVLAGRIVPMAVISVVVFALALVSRRRDLQTWQSSTTLVLAVGLFALALLQLEPYQYLTFWGLFWVGILVSILALWGAIQGRAKEGTS
ncbi:MAG TPA: hypothetical protein VJ998_09975 [Pseudomonadales bacterium]|nr:hypothetical protein [Pseudomonadales bacterium]